MIHPSNRIFAYDDARALAIIGMIFVNSVKIMDINHLKPWWADMLITFITGRAAVLFVMLAGVGMVIAHDRASEFVQPLLKTRMVLRATLLGLFGLLLMTVWDADILHFYTAYLIGGALLLKRPTRQVKKILGIWAVVSMPICALVAYGYEGGDLLEGLFDEGLLSVPATYLFFSKYYPVFPWFGFFLSGMLIGRLERSLDKRRVRILFISSNAVWVGIELLSAVLNSDTAGSWFDTEAPLWRALTITEAFPAAPLFACSAGAFGLALISFLRLLPERTPASGRPTPLAAFGRLSLTFYIAHILIGQAWTHWMVSRHGPATSHQMLSFAVFFVLAGIAFASQWTHHFKRGPLESAMNGLTVFLLRPPKEPLQAEP